MDEGQDAPQPAADDEFDEFARRAGQSLRSPAPERSLTTVVAAGRRRQGAQFVGAITVVVLLIIGVAAVRARRTDNAIARPTTSTATPTSAAPVATTAGSTSTAVTLASSPLDGWTLTYTGNPAGPVTGAPFRVGVIRGEGAPGDPDTIEVATRYLNAVGGGIAGHPIEAAGCTDGEAPVDCARRLTADPSVSVLLWSTIDAQPTADLVEAMGTAKPMLTPFVCFCQEDALAGRVASLQVSHLDAVAGAAHFLDGLDKTARIGVVSGYGQSARAVVESIVGPERTVDLTNVSTAADFSEMLATTNAGDVRHVVADIGFDSCQARGDAWREALPDATFVGVFCDKLPEGWYNVGPGYTSTIRSSNSGAATIPARLADAGSLSLQTDDGDVASNMQARWAADLFVLARIVNQLGGVEKATPQALIQAIQSYKGPVPITGDVDCTTAATNGSCVTTVPVFQLKDGQWIEHPRVSARRAP